MQSIDLADRLVLQNTADAQLRLSCDDDSLSVQEDNLVLRAARLLRDRSGFSELGAAIHLEKRIPIGAGLAGGSREQDKPTPADFPTRCLQRVDVQVQQRAVCAFLVEVRRCARLQRWQRRRAVWS